VAGGAGRSISGWRLAAAGLQALGKVEPCSCSVVGSGFEETATIRFSQAICMRAYYIGIAHGLCSAALLLSRLGHICLHKPVRSIYF
jgi:hypothetical protein